MILAVVLSLIILLGFWQGFLFAPFYGNVPHAPWVSPIANAGTGGCVGAYPPTPFPTDNSSQETKFDVLLMNMSSTATLCVIYYTQPYAQTPYSQSINPSIWLAQFAHNSSLPNNTDLVPANGIDIKARPSSFVLGSYNSVVIVSYTLTANSSSKGFYLLQTPLNCPNLLPLAVGYSGSQIGGDDFRQYLDGPLSSSSNCSLENQNIGVVIIGVSGLGIAYPAILGPANDTYSSLNSTSGVATASNPSTTVLYTVHIGNLSSLTPGNVNVDTGTQYIMANVISNVRFGHWLGADIELVANTEFLQPGTYVVSIGYVHNGTAYAKQQFSLHYTG